MHELLLVAQIPASRHTQILNVLSGVSAMQPVPILEKHIIFKPTRSPSALARPANAGAVQGLQNTQSRDLQGPISGELFHLRLVGDVLGYRNGAEVEKEEREEAGGGDEGKIRGEVNGGIQVIGGEPTTTTPSSLSAQNWTLQFRDLPEVAGRRPVTSRLIADVPITSGNLMDFMSAFEYTQTSSFLLRGHRLTHLSTSITLYQPLVLPFHSSTSASISTSSSPSVLQPLDPSCAYILQTSIRIQDGSKPDLIAKGVSELMALKEALKGLVDLEIGDRLAMDGRVR